MPWNPVTLDLYPRAGETNAADLYEDDTLTTAYQRGKFRRTDIIGRRRCRGEDRHPRGNRRRQRNLSRRIKNAGLDFAHSSAGRLAEKPGAGRNVRVNGKKINAPIHRLNRNVTAMPFGDQTGAPDADVFELTLPAASVYKSQSVEISFSPVH